MRQFGNLFIAFAILFTCAYVSWQWSRVTPGSQPVISKIISDMANDL